MLKHFEGHHRKGPLAQLPPNPFSALLFCDERTSQDEMTSVCDALRRAGCALFAAVGKHHQLWHNAFDDADLRASWEMMDESVTLTISEERLNYDSIEEWFLMSMQSQIPLEHGVILYEREAQLHETNRCLQQICLESI